MNKEYKINIDFEKNELHYTSINSGHKKPIRLTYEEIKENPDILRIFSGKDGYIVGTFYAAKAFGKLMIDKKTDHYQLFTFLAIVFVSTIIMSNILSTKLINFFGITLTGAMLIYPLSYILDYILTDIYGYQNSRRVIISTILSLVILDLVIYIIIILPPSPFWHYQHQFQDVFLGVLRTFISSTIAFSLSAFMSSYILQKIKVKNNGGSLFKRIFRSLLISEIIDTSVFCILAFYGAWPLKNMLFFIIISYFIKISYEILVYPIITQPVIRYIKHKEKLDILDKKTNFTPFSWKMDYDETDNLYHSFVNKA